MQLGRRLAPNPTPHPLSPSPSSTQSYTTPRELKKPPSPILLGSLFAASVLTFVGIVQYRASRPDPRLRSRPNVAFGAGGIDVTEEERERERQKTKRV